MKEIGNNINNYSSISPPSIKGGNNEAFVIEAHTSDNMKVSRPKITEADLKYTLPQENRYYSDKAANKRLQEINSDIYIGTKKEKTIHDFNFKRYFTIFGIIGLLTAAFTYFGKK